VIVNFLGCAWGWPHWHINSVAALKAS